MQDVQSLLAAADEAVYVSKFSGKNRVSAWPLDPSIRQDVQRRRQAAEVRVGGTVEQYPRTGMKPGQIETILALLKAGKTQKITDIVRQAKIHQEDVLHALRELRDKNLVMSIHVDEEPDGTLWRRL